MGANELPKALERPSDATSRPITTFPYTPGVCSALRPLAGTSADATSKPPSASPSPASPSETGAGGGGTSCCTQGLRHIGMALLGGHLMEVYAPPLLGSELESLARRTDGSSYVQVRIPITIIGPNVVVCSGRRVVAGDETPTGPDSSC